MKTWYITSSLIPRFSTLTVCTNGRRRPGNPIIQGISGVDLHSHLEVLESNSNNIYTWVPIAWLRSSSHPNNTNTIINSQPRISLKQYLRTGYNEETRRRVRMYETKLHTIRTLETRIKEHKKACREADYSKSAIAEHAWTEQPASC